MWFIRSIMALMMIALFSSVGQGWQVFSGDSISVDEAVQDDILAAGNAVNINAPVDSAIVAAGTVSINAPVKGDVIAAGGQVYINSDVGGKLVAAGGNINIGGNVGTNLLAAGGQVGIRSGKSIERDALIAGDEVVNAGRINGTLTVSASRFNNTGTATAVKFHRVEEQSKSSEDADAFFDIFGLLSILGYLILGVILVRYLPGIFKIVDREARRSTLLRTLIGFVVIIAAFIAMMLVAMTVVGLPIAAVAFLMICAALMLSGTFASYSLGRWISERAKMERGDLVAFLIGFVVLTLLSHLPLVGGLISLIATSIGFAAILYAAGGISEIGREETAE